MPLSPVQCTLQLLGLASTRDLLQLSLCSRLQDRYLTRSRRKPGVMLCFSRHGVKNRSLVATCQAIPTLFLCSSLWSPNLDNPPSLLLTPLYLHSLHSPHPHFKGRTSHTSVPRSLTPAFRAASTRSHSPCLEQNMLLCKLPEVLACLHIPGWDKQYPVEPGCLGPGWR